MELSDKFKFSVRFLLRSIRLRPQRDVPSASKSSNPMHGNFVFVFFSYLVKKEISDYAAMDIKNKCTSIAVAMQKTLLQ